MAVDMDVPEEFRTKKRNLLWFSVTGIALFLSTARDQTLVKVPTLDIEIPTLALGVGFIICIGYTWYGFWSETKIIIEKHSEVAEKGAFPSFEARYDGLAAEIEAQSQTAAKAWEKAEIEGLKDPDSLYLVEGLSSSATHLCNEFLKEIENGDLARTDGQTTPLFQQVIDIHSKVFEWQNAQWTFISEMSARAADERLLRQRIENHASAIKDLSSQISKLGMALTRISEQVSVRRKRMFEIYDVRVTQIVAALSMIASVATAGAAAISMARPVVEDGVGTIRGTPAQEPQATSQNPAA